MFDKEYSFKGKHADYVDKLTAVLDTSTNIKIFNRNLDVYLFAPIVGLVYGRLGKLDNSSDNTTKIFTDQLLREQHSLKYNYRLVMIVDQNKSLNIEDRLNRAFKYDNYLEKRKDGDELFNSYVLGGVEILYEKIIEGATDIDDYLVNVYKFIAEFNNRYNETIENKTIYDLCKLARDY
ncbi:MAG: hypothetical protein PWP71_2145 [Clostridia bacterium]|jgi:hypothetical protein|nr:hypothetical protein [Clostridia bacterium]